MGWFAEAHDDDWAAMEQSVYGLWIARNEARDERRVANPHETHGRVEGGLDEELKPSNPNI